MDGNGKVRRFKNPEYGFYNPEGDEPGFEAVGVSMGLMGVIIRATFVLEERYWITGTEYTVEQDDPRSVVGIEGKDEFRWLKSSRENDYIRVNYFAAPEMPEFGIKKLRHVTQWIGNRIPVGETPKPYTSIQRDACVRFLAILGMYIGQIYPISRRLLLWLFCLLTCPGDETTFHDEWWKVLPMDNGADEDLGFRVDFTEIWVPLRLANEALAKLREAWDADALMPGNFVTELYSAPKSPFWMGMSNKEPVL